MYDCPADNVIIKRTSKRDPKFARISEPVLPAVILFRAMTSLGVTEKRICEISKYSPY